MFLFFYCAAFPGISTKHRLSLAPGDGFFQIATCSGAHQLGVMCMQKTQYNLSGVIARNGQMGSFSSGLHGNSGWYSLRWKVIQLVSADSTEENIVWQDQENIPFSWYILAERVGREGTEREEARELRPKVPRLYNSCSHTWVPLREGMLDGDTEEHTRTSNQEESHSTDSVPMRGEKSCRLLGLCGLFWGLNIHP